MRDAHEITKSMESTPARHYIVPNADSSVGQPAMGPQKAHILRMPGISPGKDLPGLIYHRRALSTELLLGAVTGTSFFHHEEIPPAYSPGFFRWTGREHRARRTHPQEPSGVDY